MPKKKYTFIDLFASIGNFRTAWHGVKVLIIVSE